MPEKRKPDPDRPSADGCLRSETTPRAPPVARFVQIAQLLLRRTNKCSANVFFERERSPSREQPSTLELHRNAARNLRAGSRNGLIILAMGVTGSSTAVTRDMPPNRASKTSGSLSCIVFARSRADSSFFIVIRVGNGREKRNSAISWRGYFFRP